MRKIVAWLILLLIPASAMAEDLHTFLQAATKASRPPVPLRADGEIVVRSPDATTRDKIIIVLQTTGELYLETKNGLKALLKPSDEKVSLRPGKDAEEKKVALEDPFEGTDFTWEDLRPFDVSQWDFPVIIDKNAFDLTVQLTPKTHQYILVVATFNREKRVPIKTLYYIEKASNLVKMRTDEGLVEVASRWLPTKITMKTFALRTSTELALQWKKATDLPKDLFGSGTLRHDSGLQFPK